MLHWHLRLQLATGGHVPHLLVVVAHPDDETFATGSVLLHAAAAGGRTTVVCATLGEAGEAAPGVVGPEGLGALREGELRDAAAMLGVDQVELLGFTDSGMAGDPGPRTLCGAPVNEVHGAIAEAIARHRPDVVVTLDGGDGHRDHLVVRDAVLAATAGTDTRVYLHALPRSLMQAWVLHQAGNDKAAAYTELPDIGTPDEQLTTVFDTGVHYDARCAAIAVHASQASPFDGLPDALKRRFLATEHLIRANPPWNGGGLEDDLWG